MQVKIKIKKLRKGITLPRIAYEGDAALDLYTPESFIIKPFETLCLPLGLALELPKEYSAHLIPRSSIAKRGLIIQMEAIDSNYRGEIHLIITNCSNNIYHFDINDRLASLLFIKNDLSAKNIDIEEVEELSTSIRGSKGLGSSGR